jgi:type VI secretion system protein ImpE
MTPSELLEAGQLTEAINAAIEVVKSRPTDIDARGFLVQLLCFSGDLERADKQLDTLSHQSPETAIGVALLRQLVRGEQARNQVFTAGRVPEFVNEPPAYLQLHLKAAIATNDEDIAAAADHLRAAAAIAPTLSGSCNGLSFQGQRDLDDLTACFTEVITSNGKYYWIPNAQIDSMEFHAPERPLDLLWRRAHMIVRGGPDGEVYIPTIYHGTSQQADEQLQLGRATDWIGDEQTVVRGVGQRMLLFGETEHALLELQHVEFSAMEAD